MTIEASCSLASKMKNTVGLKVQLVRILTQRHTLLRPRCQNDLMDNLPDASLTGFA